MKIFAITYSLNHWYISRLNIWTSNQYVINRNRKQKEQKKSFDFLHSHGIVWRIKCSMYLLILSIDSSIWNNKYVLQSMLIICLSNVERFISYLIALNRSERSREMIHNSSVFLGTTFESHFNILQNSQSMQYRVS